jgi:uncharacterized protein (TIGR04222 family)
MDVLFENPLARMYGPAFLQLYFFSYVFAYLFLRFILPLRVGAKYQDTSQAIPDQPDPYKIAYLRRGESEVLILVVFNLMRRKYVSIGKGRSSLITIKAKRADLNALSMLEKDVYHCIKAETVLRNFIKDTVKDSVFTTHCNSIKKELINEFLLWSEKDTKRYKSWTGILTSALVLIGLYKLTAALLHGHANVLGLIVVSIAGSYLISRIQVKVVATTKGLTLLGKLKSAFKPVFGNKLLSQPLYMEQVLLSVHGFMILQHSKYANFYSTVVNELKPKQSINIETNFFTGGSCSSSGGGSSCSSGSGCGSSCGGGCGGGGCGGCS